MLHPENKDDRIQFIRHDNLQLGYGWLDFQGKPYLCPLSPDILIVREDVAQEFKEEQIKLRKASDPTSVNFDPSLAPLVPKSSRGRLMFNAVLTCLELKWEKSRERKTKSSDPSRDTSSESSFQPLVSTHD